MRMRSRGTPVSISSAAAASANPVEPHTNAVAPGSTSGATSSMAQPAGGPARAGRHGAGVDHRHLGAGQLGCVVQVLGRAGRDEHPHVTEPHLPGVAQHRHERHHAGAAADEDRRLVGLPGEPVADRSADLELVAHQQVVVEEGRHLAVGQALDVRSISPPSVDGVAIEYERDAV